jgi:hypothetical protein
MKDAPPRFSLVDKLRLAIRVWGSFAVVYAAVRRQPLPSVVQGLRDVPTRSRVRTDPRRLGLIVFRMLGVGPVRARCLYSSLVLYRLLREQGDLPQLVIGLPREPKDKDAHAWVEMDGRDVGPPPGGRLHRELARFG